MRKHLVSFLVLSLGLCACGSASIDVSDDAGDATVSADSGNDSSTGRDTADSSAVPLTCQGRCDNYSQTAQCQCDAECVQNGDCCGDYLKLCAAPVNPTCVDGDKDGVCSTAQKADCNDNDPTISPNLAEACGDGKDNNCNGVVDEGCPVPTPTSAATAKVTYSDGKTRTLNVQIWSDKAQLGQWWDKSVTNSSTTLVAELGEVYDTDCGLRLNVTEGANNWFCMGNGSTAQLNSSAVVSITWKGVTYGNADLSTWSAPGGTAQGCSALWRAKKTGACAL